MLTKLTLGHEIARASDTHGSLSTGLYQHTAMNTHTHNQDAMASAKCCPSVHRSLLSHRLPLILVSHLPLLSLNI